MKFTVKDWVLAGASALSLVIVLALVVVLLAEIVLNGAPVVNATFLTEAPSSDMLGGGIFPAIYGTVFMTLLMTIAGVPVGIATAVYLTEYASKSSRWAGVVRIAVQNLAGVPSIVFGLFGLGFFVLFVGGTMDTLIYGDGAPV